MSGASGFNVSIAIRLINGFTGPAQTLQHNMHQLHLGVSRLRQGFLGLGHAIAGSFALMGQSAMLHGLGKIVEHGNDLVKIQRDMAQAGFTNVEIQEAYNKAWKLTGKYQNVGAVDILKLMNDARMIFGDTHHAVNDMEPFINAMSFLRAYQGHEVGSTTGEALNREIFAAMKSGELSGKITPEAMAAHVRELTAMKVAFGEQLHIADYLTAQRAAGVALRNATDEFRYAVFPALVQENGAGAGVMLMTAYNKITAGVGNRKYAVDEMAKLGLIDGVAPGVKAKRRGHGKEGIQTGSTDLKGYKLFAQNSLAWVDKYLVPALDKATSGLQGLDKTTEEGRIISRMFPDRKAAQVLTEYVQQYQKFTKDMRMKAQTAKSLNEALYGEGSFDKQLEALVAQWKNFLNVLGAPVVPKVTEWLKTMADQMNRLVEATRRHPNAAKAVMYTLGGLASAFLVAGTAMITGFMVMMLRATGVTWALARGLRMLLTLVSPGRMFAGIGALARGFGMLSGAILAGGLLGRLALVRLALWGIGRAIAGIVFGPIGLIASILLTLVPDGWWTPAGEKLKAGFEYLKGLVTGFVDRVKSALSDLWDGLNPANSAIGQVLSGQKPATPGTFDEFGVFQPQSGPAPEGIQTIPQMATQLTPQAQDNRTITNNISVPVTVNATVNNATPQGVAGAVAGAGQSVANEVKKALSDGGQ